MKTLLCIFLFFFPIKSSYSFSADHNDSIVSSVSTGSIHQAIEIAYSAIDAEVVRAEKKYVSERLLWRLNIQARSGSSIVMSILTGEGRITEVKSDEGPFDYDLDPGQGLIRFSEAKTVAEKEAGTVILKWKLAETSSGFQYHFWFFTKGGPAQFKMNAKTGERIMKKKGKKKSTSD